MRGTADATRRRLDLLDALRGMQSLADPEVRALLELAVRACGASSGAIALASPAPRWMARTSDLASCDDAACDARSARSERAETACS